MKANFITKNQFLGILFFLLISTTIIAQVGIGNTNPNTNSLLEIGDGNDDKGVLLPRVSLSGTTIATPLTAHVAGMMVIIKLLQVM